MRIPSGVTDQVINFVAVDSTDYVTREAGLTTFTVYRSRNGGTATAMTTPTVTELSSSNMPGVYKLLLDEDMTIDSGDDSQAMVFHITHAGMAPVTLEIELYRPKITAGNTLDVTATGAAGIDWGNIENPTTTVNLSGTTTNVVNTASALTGHTAQTGDAFLRIGAAGAGLTALPWNAAWDAEVQSECADALTAYDAPTNTQLNARTLAAASYATPTNITTVATVENLTNAPTAGDLTAAMKASVTTAATAATPVAASVTGSVGSVTAGVTVSDKTGFSLSSAGAAAVMTTQMTESYSIDGSAPTPAQALLLIQQRLTDYTIASTTMTIKKVDGTTTAATLTLNDGTSPTGLTRAS